MRSSKKDLDRKAVRNFVVIAAFIVGIIAYNVYRLYNAPALDLGTFCPEGGKVNHTIVLIDRTDPLSATQRDEIIKQLNALKSRLELYEKLSIFVLSDDESSWSAKPVFSMCNPGSKANPLTNTESKVRRRFEAFFSLPLQDKLNELMQIKESTHSPILEMLQSVSVKPDFANSAHRRIVIVSDMMQNVSGYSHYSNGSLNYREFSKTVYGQSQNLKLTDVEVEILYLEREPLKKYQNVKHIRFWQEYFQSSGAKLKDIQRLR